ncbi:MAG: hypothetical protein ABW022_16505 [Actinoplanes sp.]
MKVDARVTDPNNLPALQTLYSWLRQSTKLTVSGLHSREHQGAWEVVQPIIGTPLDVASLLVALRALYQTRPRKPAITITVRGDEVTLTADSPERFDELEKLLRVALEARTDDGDE